jgi:CBS domain-containing protein/ribosome-associated translation inhibitor RaiA
MNGVQFLMKTLRELAFSEIRDIVHRHVSVFTLDVMVSRVLGELKLNGRYEAVVRSDGKFGLITLRDLLDVDQPTQIKVERVWRNIGHVSPTATVIDVAEMMVRNNVRAMPVVENGAVLGCISQVEVNDALCDVDELSNVPVKGLMRMPVTSLEVSEKIALARRMMLERGFSHVPVIEYNRLVGMVTAEEIVHNFITPIEKTTTGDVVGRRVDRFPGLVGGIMDLHPLTAEPDASVRQVVCGLRDQRKSSCVVIDKSRAILGIVTPRELMAPLLGLRIHEELPVYIRGLSDEEFYERSSAEEKVRRVVQRSLRMHPHIQEVQVKIDRSHTQGKRPRYEATARVLSPEEQFIAEAAGWDLLTVFESLCERLDRELMGAKHEPKKIRARRTSPATRGGS